MAGTPASRQRLSRELGELLSQEAMDEFMDVLPPVGWGDIARRQDITTLEHTLRADLRTEIASVRTEIASVRTDLTTAMRTQLFAILGSMFTLAGLTWAATSIS